MKSSPLEGKVICITRPLEQAKKSAELVKKRGAIPFIFPVTKQVEVDLDSDARNRLLSLKNYDCLIFTSANAVRFFVKAALAHGIQPSSLEMEVACVGPQTHAQAELYGMSVSVLPDEFLGVSLVEVLKKSLVPGSKLLYPRPEKVSTDLKSALESEGFFVDEIILYKTVADDSFVDSALEAFQKGEVDAVTFASGSAVRYFYELLSARADVKELLNDVLIAVIGPSTKKVAEKYGLKVDVVPDEFTFSGMLDSLENAFKNKP